MKTAGTAIGLIERPIFFAAFWLALPWLIPAWLVTKVSFYWQGANLAAFPEKLNEETLTWQVAKRGYATRQASVALIGTGANIIVALIGVAAGKWILF